MRAQHPALVALAFFSIYIIWGTTYLAIVFALQGFPPFILSAIRFCTAGLLLFAWCRAKGEKLPRISTLRACTISGCLMLIGGSGLVTWGEKYISSGQAAIITATEPFLFILLDKKRWSHYLSNKMIIAGLAVGFLGLIIFVRSAIKHSNTVHSEMFFVANFVLLASAVLWVTGSLYSRAKLVSDDSNLMTTALQLIAGGMGSAIIATLTTEWQNFNVKHISITAWGGLLYLIIMGSLVAYVAFTWLISIRPPAIVSTHTYVNPMVAVLLGWLVAGEQLSLGQILALCIILSGVLLTNLKEYKLLKKKNGLKAG